MRPTGNISTELERYLRSDVWRKRRDRHKSSVRHRCESCGARRVLTVYHLNYDRFNGRERNDDVVVLRVTCRSRQHPGKRVRCGPYAALYAPNDPLSTSGINLEVTR